MDYQEHIRHIAPLNTFDAKAFERDENCPQSVCDFVLALAAIHNDLNDFALAMDFLKSVAPKPPVNRSIAWAKYNGMAMHIIRHNISIVHELLYVVEGASSARASKFFCDLKKAIPAREKPAWAAIEDIADGNGGTTKLAKYLHMCRNKVGFHYDVKKIAQGYARKFVAQETEPPLISTGTSAHTTRFYFADAAIEEVLCMSEHREMIADVMYGRAEIYSHANSAVFHIVHRFINRRGFAYRPFNDNPKSPPISPLDRK